MRRRVALFVLITVATATVVIGSPWRTVVKAPRAALPDVEITLGYPGPYIPTWNAPIELRAMAPRSFNGYIGWHYAVGTNETGDGPVVSRAKLAPGERWRFESWSRIEPPGGWRSPAVPFNREVVIEWRDAAFEIVAEKSAGIPPWSNRRPLLIGTASGFRVLGLDPIVLKLGELGASAQWYQGFSAVALPVDEWQGLPPRVREAIVGSGVLVAFIGFPSAPESLPVDQRILLPVEFTPGVVQYVVPWPFSGRGTAVKAPVGWRARSGSATVGANPPPVVYDDDAAWLANAALLEQPLPGAPTRLESVRLTTERRWSARAIFWTFRSLFAGAVLLLFSIAAWLSARRVPRWTMAVLVLGAVLAALLARDWVRLQPGTDIIDSFADRGDGISVHRRRVVNGGAVPLAAPPVDPTLRATAVFAKVDPWRRRTSEIRSSTTPIGFGARPLGAGWETAERSWLRRELRPSARVNVVSAESGRLVIEYDAPADVEYAAATWFAGGQKFYGEVRLDDPRKGRVTIANRMFRPSMGSGDLWYVDENGTPVSEWVHMAEGTRVRLFRHEPLALTQFEWREPAGSRFRAGQIASIHAWMTPTVDGQLTCLVSVPPDGVAPGTKVRSTLHGNLGITRMTVATEASTEVLANAWGTRPLRSAIFSSGIGSFEIPDKFAAELSRGGLMVLTAEPAKALEPGQAAEIIVSFEEKK
ncbi:MAG: hypothetical protein WA208_01065 [Thermoanaerobaculia bacterium]